MQNINKIKNHCKREMDSGLGVSNPNQRQLRLQARRTARQQQSQEQREQGLQLRRRSDRIRQQQESAEEHARVRSQQRSAEDRQHLLEMRRYRDRTVDKFFVDLRITLVHCRVCYSLVYSDKIKEVNSAVLTDACPADLPDELTTGTIVICSKCNTQISKGHWPSWGSTNDLQPEDIPSELAQLTHMSFSQGYNPTWWSIRGRMSFTFPFLCSM